MIRFGIYDVNDSNDLLNLFVQDLLLFFLTSCVEESRHAFLAIRAIYSNETAKKRLDSTWQADSRFLSHG